MAKQIMQFRYYAEGNGKNYPKNITKAKLSDDIISSLTKLFITQSFIMHLTSKNYRHP